MKRKTSTAKRRKKTGFEQAESYALRVMNSTKATIARRDKFALNLLKVYSAKNKQEAPPEKKGKKQIAKEQASRAEKGTSWDTVLN